MLRKAALPVTQQRQKRLIDQVIAVGAKPGRRLQARWGSLQRQNSISLTGFDVERPSQIATVDPRLGVIGRSIPMPTASLTYEPCGGLLAGFTTRKHRRHCQKKGVVLTFRQMIGSAERIVRLSETRSRARSPL
jgi:hypothetical protein